ncbi:MAG TPA: M12 family metallopeptidase [Chthoniobacterales bacterium]|nr:M12 family metallopeptidase [Chthoniobacterales bacterium]
MPVTYVVKDGKAIFQGDIILEKVDSINSQYQLPSYKVDASNIDSISIAYAQYRWPKVGNQYQIPYVIAAGSGNLTNLNTAITQFNSTFSNIKFVTRTSEADYVNFDFDPNDNSAQCEANVGRVGGPQQVGGSGGSSNPCLVATILHEMGHTVGLWHEQSRADRNTYLSVNYNNLIKGSISNFDQIFDNAQQTTLFDYASIMEYPDYAYSRNGGPAIESIPAGIPLWNLTGYTAADIDGINRLYSNAPTAVTVATNPPGLQVIVDGVTVTTPQVFNWALNSTHTLNVSSNVQSLSGNIVNSSPPIATTFYYTYGRWNDAMAASHTVTILPGNGNPATPATSPAVTTYTANFIQLVPYAATVFPTGTGSVNPSPAPQSYPGSSLLFYIARQQVTLTATPSSGQNFYEFNNANLFLPGGVGANPKTFYVPENGLTINTTAEFSPDPVYTVNVAPNPFSSNLYIYADGGFWYAPKNFSAHYDSSWTVGSTHTLSFNCPTCSPPFNDEYPYSSNSRYAFVNWSDLTTNPNSDSVKLPSTSTTYTANLTPQFFVTDFVNEGCAGSINVTPASPTGDGFYPKGTGLTFSETPNSPWLFTGWQHDLSGTSSSQPLMVTDEVLVTADYNTVATPLTLTSLSPATTVPWSSAFTLTLSGTGFTPSSVVLVNGAFPTVTFVNSTQLKVPVTAAQIATPGAFQVWVGNSPTAATCDAFAALPFTVANNPIVVSRMTHGNGAGTFDVNLPFAGTRGVECRSGGANGNYTIVFQFANSLTSVGGASVTSGPGSVSSSAIGVNKNEYIVNLTGVIPPNPPGGAYVTVTLTNVLDSANNSGTVVGPQMGVLVGDVDASGRVDSTDTFDVRQDSLQTISSSNFRADVDASGRIDSNDVFVTRQQSLTSLPSLP